MQIIIVNGSALFACNYSGTLLPSYQAPHNFVYCISVSTESVLKNSKYLPKPNKINMFEEQRNLCFAQLYKEAGMV